MVIYLTGFMTSGKSTVGPILANVLGLDFYDLDEEIVKREGMSIVDIFEQKGESYFRKVETRLLKEISNNDDAIISLGGGTITIDENLKFMKENGFIVYLKVDSETLYRRLKNKTDRPLFKDLVLNENGKEEFIKRINNLLDKRSSYYEQADLTIECDSRPVGLTVDRIAQSIQRKINEKNKH
jgi:shikimate kinase